MKVEIIQGSSPEALPAHLLENGELVYVERLTPANLRIVTDAGIFNFNGFLVGERNGTVRVYHPVPKDLVLTVSPGRMK